MRKIVFIVLSALLLASLPLVGCEPVQEPTPTPGPSPVPAPGGEGVLNLYGIDPLTLDPAVSGEMTSHEYIAQIFSGLVRLDDNLKPAPDIAESWQISDDGKTYIFYLRDDVVFHDGRGVTAGDFKFSWERACDPATGSHTAATYLGDIVGAKEKLAGEAAEISGVRVIDDYTLEVTIDAPKSYFLSKLTYATGLVVDRANVEMGEEWWHQPNGTGPFKLEEWAEGNLLVLKRNDLFYGETAGVDSVVFKLWGGVPMNMYEVGDIDVTTIYINYIDKVTDTAGPFYRDLAVVSELSFRYIGFDTTRPPFDDINIRRAFSMAVNKDKLVAVTFRNMMQRADGILPPGIPGFNKGLAGLDYDVDEARALIKKSSYGDVSNLPPITITTSGWGGLISQEVEAFVQEWRENLGAEVTVRQLEPQRFLYNLKEEKDEMFYMGWIADYPHPQNFLEVLFYSGADYNYGEYSNAEVEALLDRAGLEMDFEKSLKLYQEAEQLLVTDAACIPIYFGQNYVLVKPYVRGYRMNPQGYAMLNTVSVESD